MSRTSSACILLMLTITDLLGQGVVTTVAGTDWIFDGDGKPALNAPLANPSQIFLDSAGNPVFVDTLNCIVGRIGRDGILSVVAGNGFCGQLTGLGGPATSAAINPLSATADAAGNLYVGDREGSNFLWKVAGGTISRFSENTICGSDSLARDAAGRIFSVDVLHNRICRYGADGTPAVVAGTGERGMSGDGGPATAATLSLPDALAFDSAGNMCIADWGNGRVRKVSPSGIISTVITGIEAQGLAFDNTGALYLAYEYGIARFTEATGLVDLHIPGLGSLLSIVADSGGNLLVADEDNHRIFRVSAAGVVTIAGNGKYRYTGNRPALRTPIDRPSGLAVAGDGTIYFTEPNSGRLRKISQGSITTFRRGTPEFDPAGSASLFSGTGAYDSSGDGGRALSATFREIGSLCVRYPRQPSNSGSAGTGCPEG